MTPSRLSLRQLLALALVMMMIVVSVETAAKFQVDFAVPIRLPPKNGLSELAWIRDHFGYDNANVIIDVRDTSSYLWALDYNGGLIYYGNLFYLLTNRTDYSLLNNPDPTVRSEYDGSLQRLWVYGVLSQIESGKYLILVPSDIYSPDALEMQALRPLSAGVFVVRQMNSSRLQQLFSSWNYARTSKDALGAASPYLTIHPIADCSMYGNWPSASQSLMVNLAPNFTSISSCSVHLSILSAPNIALYASLTPNVPWNLENETYIGFYLKGSTNSTGGYSLILWLTSGSGYQSYYSYSVTDKGLWDGSVQSLLLPLSLFGAVGTPHWSFINSVSFGVYTGQGGIFNLSLQYIVVAH